MTDEEVLNSILIDLEINYYISSEEDLYNSGYTIDTICQESGLEITVYDQRRYENILIEDGYIKYLKFPFKIFNITENGLIFIDKGGYKIAQDNSKNTNIHGELNHLFIENVSVDNFVEITKYKNLPAGISKILWKGSKADCIRFADYFEFTLKQLNGCFYHVDGKFRANDRSREPRTKTELTKILKKY